MANNANVFYDEGSSSEGGSSNDEASVRERLIEMIKPKSRNYMLHDIHHKSLIGLMAVWHTYLFWLAACTFSVFTCNTLLVWYVEWFAIQGATPASGLIAFLGTAFKCWIMTCVSANLLCFCYTLTRDAWRVDAFEGYRRIVTGRGLTEVAQGKLYLDEPGHSSHHFRDWGPDLIFQCIIYVSLDVLPVVMLVVAKTGNLGSTEKINIFVASYVVPVACSHVLLFWIGWTATDIALKVTSFRLAWYGKRADEEEEEAELGELPEGEPTSDDDFDNHGNFQSRRVGRPVMKRSKETHVVDRRNLCVIVCNICGCLETMLPQLWLLCIIVTGLATGRPTLVAAGIVIVFVTLTYVFTMPILRKQGEARAPKGVKNRWQRLQTWGEAYCSLGVTAQADQRQELGVLLGFYLVLFAASGWWWYTILCAVCMVLSTFKQLMVPVEKPWGWLVGISEGVAFTLGTAIVCLSVQLEGRIADAFSVIVCSMLRQMGMARRCIEGAHVRRAAIFILCGVQIILLSVCIASVKDIGKDKKFTAWPCQEGTPGCTYQALEYRAPQQTRDMECTMRFVERSGLYMTLADFGLMSTLTYETEVESVETNLEKYFPGWRIEEAHRPESHHRVGNSKGLDWTSFYQFTDPYNGTSVFAVRGTQHIIDAFQDIHLWFPATVIQFFEKAGPSIATGWVTAIVRIIRVTSFRSSDELLSFATLLDQVLDAMEKNPERLFYITGHSLGGGVAKLVAARIESEHKNLQLPAIVFAAPGLETTSAVVFGKVLINELRTTAVTVQPANDVVSRIDSLGSAVLPVQCKGGALKCHSVTGIVCNVYDRCGSMRQSPLSIPCGMCPDMPGNACPAGEVH